MRRVYLILAVIGFIAPTVLVIQESYETSNVLLYLYPLDTIKAMFSNRISTVFMIDLLFAVAVFFIWTYQEAKKSSIKYLGVVWILTMLLGLAGGFPLFLYLREKVFTTNS